MKSSESSERVARYFDVHARDFDTIYDVGKGGLRGLRDRLSRGTVVDRLAFVLRFAAKTKPKTALDVGCGAGRLAIPLARGGARIVGLDFAPEMVALAKRRAAEESVAGSCEFLEADFMTWRSPEPFDLSLAIGVFDYVADPGPLLEKLSSDTAGWVIASFPHRWHPLVPLRRVRLSLAGCPVWFYGHKQIEDLGRRYFASYETSRLGRDFMLVGRTPGVGRSPQETAE